MIMTRMMMVALATAAVLLVSLDTADAKRGNRGGLSAGASRDRARSNDPSREFGRYPSWAANAFTAGRAGSGR